MGQNHTTDFSGFMFLKNVQEFLMVFKLNNVVFRGWSQLPAIGTDRVD